MDKLDIDEIFRKNPRLDRDSFEALHKYVNKLRPSDKPRYRLAPIGTHRARVGVPNSTAEKPRRIRNYPGF